MPEVAFVFTNPRHHVDMMAPVARDLMRRGVGVRFLSLCELRGMATPDLDLPVRKVIPINVRGNPQVGAATSGGTPSRLRRLARAATAAALVPAVRFAARGADVIVIPNDIAFPYDRILAAVGRRVPIVLMQEGIRFPMPNGDRYGAGGARVVCAWGEGSSELFVARGAPPPSIAITGSPRHDGLDPAAWRDPGRELAATLALEHPPIALLTNPIETQGYGTTADKLALIEQLFVEAAPVLAARRRALVVKCHAYEDPAELARIAARTPAAAHVRVVPDGPMFAALAIAAGAIVLTSTAGIEALLFGVPIAQLEIPGHGFPFEYVARGAAVGLRRGAYAAGLAELLDGADARRTAGEQLVARHLHARGRAAGLAADAIDRVLASR